MIVWYVEFQLGCTLVKCRMAGQAKKWAIRYFGEVNGPYIIRFATKGDIAQVKSMGGTIH